MSSFFKNCLLSSASLAKVLLKSSFKTPLKTKVKKQDKLLVLGNGPSLSVSIDKYKNHFGNYDLMCVNNMSTTEVYASIQPNFYILHAFIYYVSDEQLSPLYQKMKKDTLDAIINKTTWKMDILVPFPAKKNPDFIRLFDNHPHLNLIFYNQTPVEGFTFFSTYFFKKGWGMPRPHNVLIPSIMAGILMHYKEIYFVGADHSWLSEISVNEKNEAMVNQKHFYDENESRPIKMEDWNERPRRLHEILHKFYLSFKGYWEIRPFADKQDVKVYNASETSMIDAFERKSLS